MFRAGILNIRILEASFFPVYVDVNEIDSSATVITVHRRLVMNNKLDLALHFGRFSVDAGQTQVVSQADWEYTFPLSRLCSICVNCFGCNPEAIGIHPLYHDQDSSIDPDSPRLLSLFNPVERSVNF
jgi:hypothetical protein